MELSSFKCGHDAPIYSVIESIIEKSGTPYFSLEDVDENKPTGSVRIPVETIHYFLQRYTEQVRQRRASRTSIDAELAVWERRLREDLLRELAAQQQATPFRGRMLPVTAATEAVQASAPRAAS